MFRAGARRITDDEAMRSVKTRTLPKYKPLDVDGLLSESEQLLARYFRVIDPETRNAYWCNARTNVPLEPDYSRAVEWVYSEKNQTRPRYRKRKRGEQVEDLEFVGFKVMIDEMKRIESGREKRIYVTREDMKSMADEMKQRE